MFVQGRWKERKITSNDDFLKESVLQQIYGHDRFMSANDQTVMREQFALSMQICSQKESTTFDKTEDGSTINGWNEKI